jgi:hypothetical protein
MQLIREKNKPIGRDVNIKIPLGSMYDLNGLQQSINDYVVRETAESINPVTDGETFKFVLNSGSNEPFNFKFKDGINYSTLFTFAGFTQAEIDNKDDVFTNSFFIMQIVDSINSENQILLHNSYYNGYSFDTNNAEFSLGKSNEFMNLYIPEWFLNENPENRIDVFATFYFYNAKTGKLQVFYNENNESDTTEEKMYYEIQLYPNFDFKKWGNFVTSMDMKELDNSAYVNKVNESLDSFNNEAPVFPEGEQFNNDGTYTEVTT